MATIGNLINPDYFSRPKAKEESALGVLGNILSQRAEEERKQQMIIAQEERKRQAEIAAEERKFERSKTLMDLFNSKNVNNNVSRADNSLTNSEVGAKVVKVPSNAMMSLVGGGFGDVQGNKLEELFTTAASQKDPFQTRMVMSGVNADLEPTFKMVDENEDLPQIQKIAITNAVDPFDENGLPKERQRLMSEVASKKAIPSTKQSAQEKKFALDLEDRERQSKASADMARYSAQDTLDTISEVEKGINNFGLLGNLPSIPGSPRTNWESNVKKLLSGKIVDLIAQMKNVSKTGATGLGSLNIQELRVLEEASTALKRDLSPEDAKRYIDKIKYSAQKVLQGGQSQDNLSFNSEAEAEAANLQPGTRITINGRPAIWE